MAVVAVCVGIMACAVMREIKLHSELLNSSDPLCPIYSTYKVHTVLAVHHDDFLAIYFRPPETNLPQLPAIL